MTETPAVPKPDEQLPLAQRKLALIAQLAAVEDEAVIEAAEAVLREAADTSWMSDPYLLEQLRESEEDVKAGRVVPWEVVKAEMEAKLAKRRGEA